MAYRISRIFIVAFVAAAVAIAEEPRCTASARECDQQIRQFLSGRRYLGATVEDRNPGLAIKSVHPNGPAARAGLRADDRLIAVNGRSLTQATTREFKQIIADARETGILWIIIGRGGRYMRVQARLEPYTKEQVNKIVAAHLAQSHSTAQGGQQQR